MTEPQKGGSKKSFVQCFVHFLVVFVCVFQSTPGINESHYLPKAKHVWNSSFAPGDLFLMSHDSHWLATNFAGLLSLIAPLTAVAWIGRLVSWSLFAWAWTDLCRALRLSPILSPLALASFYFAILYGHWAGEWAVGGFEAKAIAYPFVLKGVAACLRHRWTHVWLWMGLAVAWHPLVGGWAGLSVGIVWLIGTLKSPARLYANTRTQLPWLIGGGLIGLVGVLPALSGLGGPDRIGKLVASQVHVYYRLAHHMCPRKFVDERHWAAACSLLALGVATVAALRLCKRPADSRDQQGSCEPMRTLLLIAWISVGFALCGLLLDFGLASYQPTLASKLLRFYWFRWSDVAVSLAWTLTFWMCVSETALGQPGAGKDNGLQRLYGKAFMGVGAVVVVLCLYQHVISRWQNSVPPADELVVNSTGPHLVPTDRYIDWLAVCAWIRENTPTDSLWLTPKYQQTFKWHAERAEVVCWKDVPQDNASILEWYDRIQNCEPPRSPSGKLAGWSTEDLLRLHRKYGFGWILVDRTIQQSPPLLETAYPIDIENRSFAVFRIGSP